MANTIKYTLSLNASEFESGLKKAVDQLKSFGKEALSFGAVAGAAALATKAIGELIERGGKLSDLSAKTNIAVDSLQKLEHAGRLAGVGLDAMASSTAKMQRALVETPGKFAELGLSVEKLRAMKPDQQFAAIADKIASISDPAEQAAAAMDIFGKAGAEMLPLLKANLAAAADEAERLGFVLSEDQVNAADAAGDAIDTLNETLTGLGRNLASGVVENPVFTQTIKDMAETVGLLSTMARNASGAIGTLVEVMVKATPGMKALLEGFKAASEYGQNRNWQNYSLGRPLMATGGEEKSYAGPDPFSEAGQKSLLAAAGLTKEYQKQIDKLSTALALSKQRATEDKALVDYLAKANREALRDIQDKGIAAIAKQNEQRILAAYLPSFGEMKGPAGRQMGSTMMGSQNNGFFDEPKKFAVDWQGALSSVGQAFQMLGVKIESTVGRALQGLTAGASAGAGIGKLFGPVGAGIGAAIGAGVGLFGSLFGGGDKKREEAKKQREKDQQDALASLNDLSAKWEQFQAAMSARASGAVSSMFSYMATNADLSSERLAAMGMVGVSTFNAMLKSGKPLLEALDAMGPGLDKLIEKAGERGLDLGALSGIADLKSKVNENRELVEFANQLGGALDFVRLQGQLTAESFTNFQNVASGAFSDLIEKGFSTDQAIAVMGPTLLAVAQAAEALGMDITAALDAVTGGHGAEAQKAIESMKSPMDQLKEVMELQVVTMGLLAKAFGVDLPKEVQKLIDKLNQIPSKIPVEVPITVTGDHSGGANEAVTGNGSGGGGGNQGNAGFGGIGLPGVTVNVARGDNLLPDLLAEQRRTRTELPMQIARALRDMMAQQAS